MKILCTNYANLLVTIPEQGKPEPQAEVVLVLGEPGYVIMPSGKMKKRIETTSVRFAAAPKDLRKAATEFLALADRIEKEAKEVLK